MLAAIFGGLFRATTVWIIVVSLAIWGAYEVARPTIPSLTPSQQALVADMAEDVAQWVRGMDGTQGLVALPNLGRDHFGVVSDSVREGLWRSGRLDVADYTLEEKLRRNLLWTRATPQSVHEAVSLALERDCDHALWGQVTDFSHVHGKAVLHVRLTLLDAVREARSPRRPSAGRRRASPCLSSWKPTTRPQATDGGRRRAF